LRNRIFLRVNFVNFLLQLQAQIPKSSYSCDFDCFQEKNPEFFRRTKYLINIRSHLAVLICWCVDSILYFWMFISKNKYWKSTRIMLEPQFRFCYTAYNSPKLNGFINCTFWSIIVVITLGKCAHRMPSGIRERHTCIGLI
jgi:hypothetical protein